MHRPVERPSTKALVEEAIRLAKEARWRSLSYWQALDERQPCPQRGSAIPQCPEKTDG
mgnify:CR=1 FL=1